MILCDSACLWGQRPGQCPANTNVTLAWNCDSGYFGLPLYGQLT